MEKPNLLTTRLAEKSVLIADGAMGTNLFALGLLNGDCGEMWNIEQPDKVRSIHQSMVDAGAEILLTNTFGANRYRLDLHKFGNRAREINMAGVAIAREVADAAPHPVIVAGSVGPTGDVLEPLGTRTKAEAVDAFADQMQAMTDAGADVIWIETIFAKNELDAAIEAVERVGVDYVSTMTFDTGGKTMMGDTPRDAARHIDGKALRPVAFGANCGVGPAQMLDTLIGLKSNLSPDTSIVTKCNCGVPQMGADLEIHYSGTPEIMAEYACLARDAGAKIIGGCCGTTATHIKAMATALSQRDVGPPPTLDVVEKLLGELNRVSQESSEASDSSKEKRAGRGRRRGRAVVG